MNGLLRLTYNALWGHYAFHWESNSGDFLEDDEGDVTELIHDFEINDPHWYIEKATEIVEPNSNGCWCMTWIIENGTIKDYFQN